MRAVYIAAAAVLVSSLLCNWWQYKLHKAMIAEREAAAIATMQDARDADNSVFATFDKKRNTISQEAQEKRDVLKEADSADNLADLLERCRRGLFCKSADSRLDTSSCVNDRMSKPNNP